ncbi:amidase signature enzyme [Thozetella sp. PMI_491]|nr:amidase signature enzyme [Thozetella sp. PMI_491]
MEISAARIAVGYFGCAPAAPEFISTLNLCVKTWKVATRQRGQEQLSLIPQEWRLKIVPSADVAKKVVNPSHSAPYILDKLRTSTWSAYHVTLACCKRAAVAQQLTSCLTEIFFNEALAQATELDEILQKTGKPLGPLHGLSISLKDSQAVQGADATNGWLARTNIPQSTMMSDSYNHLFGQSVNSLDRHLISGDSPGGEGALVASGGSVLGIGTDVGGSLRVPSTLQGRYGLCPSIGRIDNRESVRRRANIIPPVAGPMARDLDSIDDPAVLPTPWREDLVDEITSGSKGLKIGYVRAVLKTVNRFRAAGHDLMPWDTLSHAKGYQGLVKAILSEGGRDAAEMCKKGQGELLIPGMLTGTAETYIDADERQNLSDQILKASQLDALIMPTTQWTAFAVPATVVSLDKDKPSQEWKDHKARSVSDRFNHDYYDVDLFGGMPVGVKIVTGRFGEEMAIGIAKESYIHTDTYV